MIYEEIVVEKWGNYRTSKAKRKTPYNRPEERLITYKGTSTLSKKIILHHPSLEDGVVFSKCRWTFIPSELTVDIKDKKGTTKMAA